MGFFDFVQKKINDFESDVNEARDKAYRMNVSQLCGAVGKGNFAEKGVYGQELQNRARQMKESELEMLFNEQYKKRNVAARNILASVMEENGQIYRDENGKLHKAR